MTLRNHLTAAAILTAILAAGTANAADIHVDGSGTDAPACGVSPAAACATIQYAITTRAVNDDRIIVAPGVYEVAAQSHPTNPMISVNKRVQVLGAQAGVDARSRTFDEASESVIQGTSTNGLVYISAAGATFDGFTVRGNTRERGLAVNGANANDITVQNTIFTNNRYGMTLGSRPGPTTVIRRNLFKENNNHGGVAGLYGRGIYGDTGINDTEIVDNAFEGHMGSSMSLDETFATDLGLPGTPVGTGSRNLVIARNSFTGIGAAMSLIKIHDVTVAYNTIHVTGELRDAIMLSGATKNVEITGNTITRTGRDGVRIDRYVDGNHDPVANREIRIVGNSISGTGSNSPGAAVHTVRDTSGGDSIDDTVIVRANRIVGNTLGVYNGDGSPVDARHNWWGCNAGPGTEGCDRVAGGNIDASPWLVLRMTAYPIPASPNASSTAKAVLTTDSDGDSVTFPDFPAQPVAFSVTGGATLQNSAGTLDAVATLTNPLTLGGTPGPWSASVTLDNATATVAGTAVAPGEPAAPTAPSTPTSPGPSAPAPRTTTCSISDRTPPSVEVTASKPLQRDILARRPIVARIALSERARVSGSLQMWVTTPARFPGQDRVLIKVTIGNAATVIRPDGTSVMRIVPTKAGVAAVRAALRKPGARANGWRIVGMATDTTGNTRAYWKVLGGRTVQSVIPPDACRLSRADVTAPRASVTAPATTLAAVRGATPVRATLRLNEPATVSGLLVVRIALRDGRTVPVLVGSVRAASHPTGTSALVLTPRRAGIASIDGLLRRPGSRMVDWRINGTATDAATNRSNFTTRLVVR